MKAAIHQPQYLPYPGFFHKLTLVDIFVVMDEAHLIAAARYVSLNPVRARLVQRAEDWPWSSVRAHLAGRGDGLVNVKPLLDRVSDFAALLRDGRFDENSFARIRDAETTGRPLATAEFVVQLERILGRRIARRAPGRKPSQLSDDQVEMW